MLPLDIELPLPLDFIHQRSILIELAILHLDLVGKFNQSTLHLLLLLQILIFVLLVELLGLAQFLEQFIDIFIFDVDGFAQVVLLLLVVVELVVMMMGVGGEGSEEVQVLHA